MGEVGRDPGDRYSAAPMAISVSDEPVAPWREPAGRPAHDEPATARASNRDEPRSHRTSIIAGVAALVVLAGLLVLAGLALTSDASGSQQHVVFVGDSITDQARSALVAALPADDTVDVQAVPGRRFDEMLPFALQARGRIPIRS